MDDWSAAIWYACARPLCEAAYTPTVIESCAHRSVAIACSELCRNSLPSTEEERPARRPRMRAPLVSTGRAPPPRCARTASMAAETGPEGTLSGWAWRGVGVAGSGRGEGGGQRRRHRDRLIDVRGRFAPVRCSVKCSP